MNIIIADLYVEEKDMDRPWNSLQKNPVQTAKMQRLIWRVSMKNRKSDSFSKKKTLRLMPQGKLFINVSSDSF